VTFEVRPPAQGKQVVAPRAVRRLPDPVYGRAGRAVAPGATVTYLLAVPLPARGLAKSAVRVTSASFFEGVGVSAAPVVVEDVASKRVADEFGGFVLETTARLRSTSELPVDAVLLARCKSPENARVLLARRVPPRETVTWTFRDVPLAIDTPGAPSVAGGLSVQRLEVVDWSVLTDDGRAEGAAILSDAWRRWVRWEEPFPAAKGRFAYRNEPGGGAAASIQSVAGSFELDGDGRVTAMPDTDVSPETGEALRRAIAEAFGPVRRPSPERAVSVGLPSLLERGPVARVRCETPPSGERGPADIYEIEEGVIRRRLNAESPESIQETWTTEQRGGGYVVTATELRQAALNGGKPSDTARFEYGESSGRVVPRRYVRTTDWTGTGPGVTTLELKDVALEGTAASPDVVVEAPAEVREAWEGVYRDPATPVELTASFVVESAGGEALWLGERRVSGRLTLNGFTGFRPEASRWERATLDVEGKLPDAKRRALADLVEDRLRIWAHRSFSARAPFDVAFRGAVVRARPGAPGTYDVTNGPCTVLRIEDRRVVEWDAPSLVGGTIGYTRVGETWVASSLQRGGARVSARFQDAGGGRLVPVEMRFERVFGPDWGPETVTLADLRLTVPGAK